MDQSDSIGPEEHEWLELLAGRSAGLSADRDARQVLQLRAYFVRSDAEIEQTLPDPQAQARMLQRLRAVGLLGVAAAPTGSGRGAGSALRALFDLLFPPLKPMGFRYATVAFAFMVAALTFPPMSRSPDGLPDGLPDGVQDRPAESVTKGFEAPSAPSTTLILSDDPGGVVAQIAAALRDARVEPTLTGQGAGWEMRAVVPKGQRSQVRERLARWGIAPDANGAVRVEIKRR